MLLLNLVKNDFSWLKNLDISINKVDLYKSLVSSNTRPVILDIDKICDLTEYSINKDFYNVILQTLQPTTKDLIDNKVIFDKLKDNVEIDDNYNLLDRFVFMVESLEGFISKLKEKNFVVNGGPQSLRAQSDSLMNKISVIDNHFRDSLDRHNKYHYSVGNIGADKLIPPSRFSYRNIHQNLGNVRYYTTKTSYTNDVTPASGTKSKYFLLNSIYQSLTLFIEKNPINLDTQLKIESFLMSQYTAWKMSKRSHSVLGVDLQMFTSRFNNFLLEKKELLGLYINKIRRSKSKFELKSEDPLSSKNNIYYLRLIINNLDTNTIINLILYEFLKLLTYNDSDYDNINALGFAINFGKNISREYLAIEYRRSNDNLSFSLWKDKNKSIVSPFEYNNKLFDFLGVRILVELLIQTDLIHEEIIISKEKNKQQKILCLNKEVLSQIQKNIFVLPLKLPMIVVPKLYKVNQLGGYLLNDVEVTSKLLIDKANYKIFSRIDKENIIYDMVNNINATPYKINKEVLSFILEYGVMYDIIMDINKKHEYSDIKRTKRQDRIYRSHMSKIILEQNILGIATTYKNVPNMYFPVRLDQRGRVYCEPNYLNYQSNELAKSLISFVHPGKIKRNDNVAISYFKAYGAICYGNGLEKKSLNKRVQWIDENIKDIINYKDGYLIQKAKNKCLFLAFCIEYTRFYKFLQSDSIEFETYLPIQLDATCNGFQHLALLSNETKIFKELNLTKSTRKEDPKDLYTYLINKLTLKFKENSTLENISEDKIARYKRLNTVLWAVLWDRKNIKKAIMTIPYNASLNSITQYIKDTLKRCDLNEHEKSILYNNRKLKQKKLPITETIDFWYCMDEKTIPKRLINDGDINLLASEINYVINKDFPKITKLSDYLTNIASVCCKLNIPISWALPHGLHI